jgi:hypothetical protein
MPPTTPPTIGPIDVFDFAGGVGLGLGLIDDDEELEDEEDEI